MFLLPNKISLCVVYRYFTLKQLEFVSTTDIYNSEGLSSYEIIKVSRAKGERTFSEENQERLLDPINGWEIIPGASSPLSLAYSWAKTPTGRMVYPHCRRVITPRD